MKVMIIAGAVASLSFGSAGIGQAEPVVLQNPPGEPDVTVKLIVPGSIALENVAVSETPVAVPVAPSAGVWAVTAGGEEAELSKSTSTK